MGFYKIWLPLNFSGSQKKPGTGINYFKPHIMLTFIPGKANPSNTIFLVLLLVLVVSFSHCRDTGDAIVHVGNDKIELGFDKRTGAFIAFRDMVNNQDFLDEKAVTGLPWVITFHQSSGIAGIDETSPFDFSYSAPEALTLVLEWKNFAGTGNRDLQVTARITLDQERALSYWKISVEGIKGEKITSVVFPRIEGLKDLDDEELAVSTWMGQLIKEPRSALSGLPGKRWEWAYPGYMSSQVLYLYNAGRSGFYASCNDSLSYTKNFSYRLDTLNTLAYEMTNFPGFDSALSYYTPSYDAVIGAFRGDWITAAELYREWALKQRWADESRFKNGLTPSWLENTALWVWNRGESDNVLTPAVELKQRLGLPVSVLWHWWHGCSYDDNFPEYMPPREGKESFINAVKAARDKGVRSHVYMNALQWGDASADWTSGKVEPYTVKDVNGDIRSHVYNIFSGNALINMCVGTEFWRDHYSSLSDDAVNMYHTDGVYMDQTNLSRLCYDSSHGHDVGGGNYWVENSGKLINQVRSNDYGNKQPIFTGEGSSENWLSHLDAFLTLQASMERYAGVGHTETIPFFQAVYHQYGITYGSYSSLVTPPYDELWPEEHAPRETEQPLDEIFNRQFLMEQARSFVWGMQPAISNYHDFLATEREQEIDYLLNVARLRYQGLKYLLYGKFLRPPDIAAPEKEIDISRLSIYAGRRGEAVTSFKKSVPLLYSGAWLADDHEVGIALASISDSSLPIDFTFNTGDFGLSPAGEIYITGTSGRELLMSYNQEEVRVEFSLEPRGLRILEVIPSDH